VSEPTWIFEHGIGHLLGFFFVACLVQQFFATLLKISSLAEVPEADAFAPGI
jgi:hypothetical protein